MSGYTPSDRMVEERYVVSPQAASEDERRGQYRRWLAAHDARVASEAAEKALRDAAIDYQKSWPVYPDSWLRGRADEIEKGASDDQS